MKFRNPSGTKDAARWKLTRSGTTNTRAKDTLAVHAEHARVRASGRLHAARSVVLDGRSDRATPAIRSGACPGA